MLLVPKTLKQYREDMSSALKEGKPEEAATLAAKLSPARGARILSEAPRETIIPFLKALKPQRAGLVLGYMPSALAAEILMKMKSRERAHLISHMPVDRAADVVARLPKEQGEKLLDHMAAESKEEILRLSRFAPESAGAAMTTRFVALNQGVTVGETLEALDSAPPEVEHKSYVYLVDEKDKPVGVLSLREMLNHDEETPVMKVMNPNVIAVRVDDSAVEAAKTIRNRRFLALPVVDEKDALAGIITLDDAMGLLARNVADQFSKVGAASVEESFFTPPMGSVKRRLPWMAANVFLNLGAVAVIASFEATIETVAILAIFLPMITDMGGNVGIQALSVAIRSIALGEVRLQEYWRATRKELLIGLVNGAVLGALFGVIALVWVGNPTLGFVAGTALAVNVLLAGVIGGTLPFLIKRMGKDPAMMTGPVLTTITDITGVSIYLGLSTIFLANILGS